MTPRSLSDLIADISNVEEKAESYTKTHLVTMFGFSKEEVFLITDMYKKVFLAGARSQDPIRKALELLLETTNNLKWYTNDQGVSISLDSTRAEIWRILESKVEK